MDFLCLDFTSKHGSLMEVEGFIVWRFKGFGLMKVISWKWIDDGILLQPLLSGEDTLYMQISMGNSPS